MPRRSATTRAPSHATSALDLIRRGGWWVVVAVAGAAVATAVGIWVTRLLTSTPEASGGITIDSIDENQTLRQFLGKSNDPTAGGLLGFVAHITRTSEHTSKGECRLRWTVLDAAGPRPVSDRSLVDQAPRWIEGDPTACSGAADIWIPIKPTLGIYAAVKLRFRFLHGDDPLETADSPEPMPLG